MLKNLLRLLASSATFVAIVVAANVAIAAPKMNNASAIAIKLPSTSVVSLNVISSSLEATCQADNSSVSDLGCSCLVCTQVARSS